MMPNNNTMGEKKNNVVERMARMGGTSCP